MKEPQSKKHHMQETRYLKSYDRDLFRLKTVPLKLHFEKSPGWNFEVILNLQEHQRNRTFAIFQKFLTLKIVWWSMEKITF